MINIIIIVHKFHITFKKLSILDGSFISMRSSKNLDFDKMLQEKFWLFKILLFCCKNWVGLKKDALWTTAEPIGDFSNIFFNMATTKEWTSSKKLATDSFSTKTVLCNNWSLFSAVKPRLNFLLKHFPCSNQSFRDLGQTYSHLCHASHQSAFDFC